MRVRGDAETPLRLLGGPGLCGGGGTAPTFTGVLRSCSETAPFTTLRGEFVTDVRCDTRLLADIVLGLLASLCLLVSLGPLEPSWWCEDPRPGVEGLSFSARREEFIP